MNSKQFIIDERLETIIASHSESQLLGLRQSLEAMGCIDPIVVWGEIIWDGTLRYKICQELGIGFEVKCVEFDNMADAAIQRINHHRHRRQINITNRIESALDLFEGELAVEAKENLRRGARIGGLVKAETNDSETEVVEKVWVNSLIGELADTNSTYVSVIRNLREKAENNDSDAKGKLFKLRRGDISISSVINSSKTKTTTQKTRNPKTNNNQKTLIEDYDDDKWGMKFALKEMKYEKLKDRSADIKHQENFICPDNIFKKITPYCKGDKLYDLVALLVPLLEIGYRIGFVQGSKGYSEDGIRAEFDNRDFELQTHLRKWMQNQDEEMYVKGNADEQKDSVE